MELNVALSGCQCAGSLSSDLHDPLWPAAVLLKGVGMMIYVEDSECYEA